MVCARPGSKAYEMLADVLASEEEQDSDCYFTLMGSGKKGPVELGQAYCNLEKILDSGQALWVLPRTRARAHLVCGCDCETS